MDERQPVSEWAKEFSSNSTRMAYTSAVFLFLSNVYGIEKEKKITATLAGQWEKTALKYITEDRNNPEDLIKFATFLSDRPPKTARTYIAAVTDWMAFNDIELTAKQLRTLKQKTPKGGAVTVEKDMDCDVLRSILHHLNLMMKALVLLLASSGMRIGEALDLDLDDIDLDGDIGKITIRGMNTRGTGTKNRQQRYTFCSAEAADAIREWLKKRDGYLKSSQNKGRGLGIEKSMDDNRVFPISDTIVGVAWEHAVLAAGLHSRDPVTNRLQIHIHMLRKFYSSQLRLIVPADVVEGLMGHSGYLSDAYRRYTRKQVEDLYRKGEPYVTIQISDEIRELRTTTEKKMAAHSEILEGLVQKSINQERMLKEQQNLIETLQKVMQSERE